MNTIERSLRVGDKVRCSGYAAGGRGVVVEQLQAGYVRVRWKDSPEPSTHRDRSLRRASLWPWGGMRRA